MTLEEYRAELAHLEQMYSKAQNQERRSHLAKRSYEVRAAVIQIVKRELLIEDLKRRGVAVEVVKRFKVARCEDAVEVVERYV